MEASALGIELFERAVEARGRILRVERRAPTGHADDPQAGIAFLLTFDVGRVLVGSDGAAGGLELAFVERGEDVPAGLEDLAEEEPWWRVLGNPLCGAWPGALGEAAESSSAGRLTALCLQFREDHENPKLIALRAEAPGVRVSIREPVRADG
jgi:hypothetical protein